MNKAKSLGVNTNALSKGKIPNNIERKITNKLGVDPSSLMKGDIPKDLSNAIKKNIQSEMKQQAKSLGVNTNALSKGKITNKLGVDPSLMKGDIPKDLSNAIKKNIQSEMKQQAKSMGINTNALSKGKIPNNIESKITNKLSVDPSLMKGDIPKDLQ